MLRTFLFPLLRRMSVTSCGSWAGEHEGDCFSSGDTWDLSGDVSPISEVFGLAALGWREVDPLIGSWAPRHQEGRHREEGGQGQSPGLGHSLEKCCLVPDPKQV